VSLDADADADDDDDVDIDDDDDGIVVEDIGICIVDSSSPGDVNEDERIPVRYSRRSLILLLFLVPLFVDVNDEKIVEEEFIMFGKTADDDDDDIDTSSYDDDPAAAAADGCPDPDLLFTLSVPDPDPCPDDDDDDGNCINNFVIVLLISFCNL
jgi:hypothetical protein